MAAIASTSRLKLPLPCLCRVLAPRRSFVNRTPILHPIVPRIPPQKEPLTTVGDVLKASGRGMDEHVDKFETWDDLFASTGESLAEKGLTVKDRKHLMRALQWYRLGYHPGDLVTPRKPPKKFRGHGTRIQKGKLVPERMLFRGKHRRVRRLPKDVRKRWIPLDSPLRADKLVRKRGKRLDLRETSHVYPAKEWNAMLHKIDPIGGTTARPAATKRSEGSLETQ